MKDGQDKIYYISADSFAAAKNSPHLEIFRKKGLEVLLLTDRVDEWLMSHLADFEGKQFQSVAKGALDLDKIASRKRSRSRNRPRTNTRIC
jgi:molecular chaperone HtpG